ncbi:MAG: response regulator [Desulfuromonadaceae bacterium]|nr:response regulator [Desulfuromonadaceae bacterium]
MIIYSSLEERNDTIESLNREMQSLVLRLASQQEIIVAGAHELLKTLSQLEDFQNKRIPRINNLLINILEKNEQYGNILVADPDGTVIASARPFKPKLSIADRKFYRDVVKTKRFSPGEYVIGRTALKPLINFGFPVMGQDGTIRAIIAVGINLTYLDKIFSHFVLPKGSNSTIFDHNGIILHRATEAEKYVGKPVLSNNFKLITDGAKEGNFTSIGIDGVLRHYYYTKIFAEGFSKPYMYVGASVPDSYIKEVSQEQILKRMSLFGIFLSISLISAFLIAKYKISLKVQTLVTSINAFTKRVSVEKIGDRVSTGEFGLIARAFDELSEKLQARNLENVQAKEALLREKEYAENLLQGANIIIIGLDTSGCVTIMNRTAEEITGYSRTELLGQNFFEKLLPIEFNSEPYSAPERIENGNNHFVSENQIMTKSGERRSISWRNNQIVENEVISGTLLFGIDVTEHRSLENQLRQSQKMEAIGHLAGGVAHDFNNILTVIMGYANLLNMDAELKPFQKEAADQIIASSEKAAQLTKGLLAFSRKQALDIKNSNLNDIVHHVEKFLIRIIGEDIQFKSIYNEQELPVNVDSSQIEQVLINLAANGRDAMQKGGILTIETGLKQLDKVIEYASEHAGPGLYACITVSDTGSGMDAETRSKIFEPFFTTKDISRGTGLGMAIVYGIIQQHNGFIDVYSEPGMGSTFRIYLPIVEAKQSDSIKIDTSDTPRGGTETILLAEDEKGVRTIVTTWLTKFGYEVILAEDGQEAVEKFSANRDRISLIIMDMIMPKKNGVEAYEEICQIQSGVKVLYSSGYTADFIKNRGVSEDGIELIMKPTQPMELLRKIRAVLDR